MSVHIRIDGPGGPQVVNLPPDGTPVLIGRGGESQIILPDERRNISRVHLAARAVGSSVAIEVMAKAKVGLALAAGEIRPGETGTMRIGDTASIGPFTFLVEGAVAPMAAPMFTDQVLSPAQAPGWFDPPAPSAAQGPRLTEWAGLSASRAATPAGREAERPDTDDPGLPQPGSLRESKLQQISDFIAGPAEDPVGIDLPLNDPPDAQARPDVGLDDWGLPGPARVPGPVDASPDWGLARPEVPPSASVTPPPSAVVPAPAPASARAPAPVPAPVPPPATVRLPDRAAADMNAFARGLGLRRLDNFSSAEWERLGQTFRLMVEGMNQLLADRRALKVELRVGSVTEFAGHAALQNNPLKTNLPLDELVGLMVQPPADSRAFMPADRAIRDAVDVLRSNNLAIIAAARSSIQGAFKEFEPSRVRGRAHRKSGKPGAPKGEPSLLERARLWAAFVDLYMEDSAHMADWIERVFSRYFVDAYAREEERLNQEHIALP